MKKYFIILISQIMLILLGLIAVAQFDPSVYAKEESNATIKLSDLAISETDDLTYSVFLSRHGNEMAAASNQIFHIGEAIVDKTMVIPGASYDYHDDIIKLENKQTASLKISVENSGLYDIYVDYYFGDGSTSDTEGSIRVNGQFQYYEARQIVLKANWLPKTDHFSVDRYGNEIVPSSVKDIRWYRFENHEGVISDGSRLHDGTMKVALNAGENTIDITLNNGSVFLGDVTLTGSANVPTYDEYIKQYQNAPKNSQLITIEPEYITGKNDLAIRLASERDPSCKPNYDTVDKLLNNVYHDSWNKGNQSISWDIDVPSDGLYNLAFKYIQYGLIDIPAYRTITVDGVLPYQELNDYAFNYAKSWTNESLNIDGGMLYVYLTKGTHQLTMTVSLEKYRYLIEETNRIMKEMNDMSLQIKGLTNGQSDQYRDWEISKYIPNLESELLRWANELDNLVAYGNELSDAKNGSSEFANLELGAKKLRTLAKDPDQIPNRMGEFTDGDSSVSQYLGNTMLKLYQNPLGLEKIYLAGEGVKIPKTKANIFVRLWEGIKRFFLSFFNKEYGVSKVAPDEIEIWVRRSRQYIEIMQKMVDEAGLKVKFSIMPDENKLVLANASKDLPDVAMGVDNWIPYDLAIRGITVDLRQFAGYEEMVSKMTKGALIPYIYQTGMYGIPETQDFWVLFYRTDITEKLGIAIPETWDDVVGVLPQLQRLGLNFYEPLSSYTGLKPFVATLPFLYQFGGSLYSEDGMTTTLSSEANIKALKFMTDLFTIYNVPQEVTNFYNYFRYGTLPIGIANSATYLQLLVAAPEIKGNWDLALHPGYKDASGNVYHYAATGSQGIMMFNQSKKQQQSFDFIKWWMSTDVQKEFILNLQSMYGEEYMWFTANNEAFDALPIPTSHKELIKEQWSWAMEASRIPAAYMVERSISDAFSKIVFNGENTRIALDDAVIDANREIARKMEEFGYMKDGVKIKDYIVPTIYNIDQWLTEEGD